ncbi:hypothetical protein H1O16_gp346 [Burkholderia phage BcepSaruman]|uniref:Uncharacterized protein n=1 Tax=Burkholderia phage BcepSaruman TaxID=2530032 RepID=A0A4D5ZDH9_9CAUD|nr:hypothetical protein H1O16_gp346 [Burkholderia phage BcepSaruman]QBX06759.1 hypothetical protein BcepSaruman_346 [Burkholderia phage BcepSaruman]
MRATHAKLEVTGDRSALITADILARFIGSEITYLADLVDDTQPLRVVNLRFRGDLADLHGEKIMLPFADAVRGGKALGLLIKRINCATAQVGYAAHSLVDQYDGATVDTDAETGKIVVTVRLQRSRA